MQDRRPGCPVFSGFLPHDRPEYTWNILAGSALKGRQGIPGGEKLGAMDAFLQESFDWVMGASLDELVAGHPSVAAPTPEVAGSWDIPPGDRDALRRWGIPVMSTNPKSVAFKPDVQDSVNPELAWEELAAYRLGSYHYRHVGAVQGSGAVVGVPQDRPYPYSFVWLNGSVSAFIDIAWRYTLAKPILWHWEEAEEFEQLGTGLERVMGYARSADRMVAEDERFRWWNELDVSW